MQPLILDLYSESGNFSRPYLEAGYDVVQVDLKRGGRDVRLLQYIAERTVYGIIACPPCTIFSKARNFLPTDAELLDGLSCFDAVTRLVVLYKPKFWVIENPFHSRIRKFYGPPRQRLVLSRFGFCTSKETGLWGSFNFVPYPDPGIVDYSNRKFDNLSTKQRAETPVLLGECFYTVNNILYEKEKLRVF